MAELGQDLLDAGLGLLDQRRQFGEAGIDLLQAILACFKLVQYARAQYSLLTGGLERIQIFA